MGRAPPLVGLVTPCILGEEGVKRGKRKEILKTQASCLRYFKVRKTFDEIPVEQ